MPCKFIKLLGFENKSILKRKVAISGVSSGQMVLLQEMSRRVCPSSCQFEINAFPSFVSLEYYGDPKLHKS